MADFSIIADTSSMVLRLLRENLCPEPIQSPEAISLVSPSDKNSDFQLGVFLYDLKELAEYKPTTPVYGTDNVRRNPPRPLTLSYMLFMNNKAQIAAGAEMEQRIFGRGIQTLLDNSTLSLAPANPYLDETEDEVTLGLLNLSFEDKTKIWTALSIPYQLGVYFTASPVMLSTRRALPVGRVLSTSITTVQKNDRPRRPTPAPPTEGGG